MLINKVFDTERDEIVPNGTKVEIERLRHENEEYERLFSINWDADQRAIKRWQEAHPGNDLVWPDRADMVVWLLEQTSQNSDKANNNHPCFSCVNWPNDDVGCIKKYVPKDHYGCENWSPKCEGNEHE